MNQLQVPTLVSRPDLKVVDILDEKAKATTPERAVDYIGYTNTYIEDQIFQCKQEIDGYKTMIKTLEQHQARIKHGVANWIIGNGVDKIEGLKVSSVTYYKPKQTKLVIHNKSWAMNNNMFTKTEIDEAKIKKFLAESEIDYSEFAEMETTFGEPLAKIN